MQKKKNSNRGFSLVELIIVIAIMAVLVGVLAPQYLKYVERAKRTVDIQTAKEICDAFNRVYSTEVFDTYVGGGYYPATGWDNRTSMPTPGDPSNTYADLVFLDLGSIPQSATFKNFMWCVYTDAKYGQVTKIELWETSGPGGRPIRGSEIWPNSEAFLNLK